MTKRGSANLRKVMEVLIIRKLNWVYFEFWVSLDNTLRRIEQILVIFKKRSAFKVKLKKSHFVTALAQEWIKMK